MAITLNSASFLNPETLNPRLAWARNIVFANLQADTNWHLNNSYYLELEIGIYDINTLSFTKFGESLIEEPNSEGTVIFEIQQKMQDYEGINVPVPDFNATQIVQHTTPKFYIKIFEVVDNEKTQIALDGMTGAVENRYYLVDGIDAALDRENFSYEQQFDWIFGDIENGDRRFLTSVEDPKSTTYYANEFLYWFGSQPNRDLTVDCKIYYDDDTEETVRLFDYLAGYHIQCIPTRYDIIKAKSTQPTKKISAWSVYAAYNSFLVSQYFRYEIADQPNREAKYFLAKNSFGVFDTLVCQGDYEEFLEAESETASKRDFANYSITDAQKFIISKTGKRGGTANTAFLNKLQSVVKQDFVLSREMLLQGEIGFIPIVVEKTKHVYSIKNNFLIGYSFEYAHAHNVTHYTNKIFRPILGEVPTPPGLPKFNIKNTGPSGYVRVKYDSIIVDVAPNSEENIEIGENISITVTWLIVNPDTLLLDASRINVSYPNYAFPSRIDIATFDSVVQVGSTVVGIPDENSIKKARSFTFIMPNNDYFAEVKFKEVGVVDIDFENPICSENTVNNSTVMTVKDRQEQYSYTQATPSSRAKLVNSKLVFEDDAAVYFKNLVPLVYQNLFLVGEINRRSVANAVTPSGFDLDGTGDRYHVLSLTQLAGNTYVGVSSYYNKFGSYGFFPAAHSGNPTPLFTFHDSYLNKPLLFSSGNGVSTKLFINNQTFGFENNLGVGTTPRFYLGQRTNGGKMSISRSIYCQNLLPQEYDVINQKLKEKYNT